MIFPSIFAILVGSGMIGMWSVSFFSKQIPELESEPVRIKFHLAAEFATALLLICAGIALLTQQSWGIPAYLVATGMLFYTAIVSPGYFAQKGGWAYVVMFGVILVLAIINLFLVANQL
jgi:hypothetical protein